MVYYTFITEGNNLSNIYFKKLLLDAINDVFLQGETLFPEKLNG